MRGPGAAARPWRSAAAAAALYLALAVAATWPLVTALDASLVVGTEDTPTVPRFSAWTLCWNADRVAHAWDGYWAAPILAPSRDAFALSEPMPLPGLLTAPLVWWSGPALAAGVWALAALLLNGLAGRALALRLGTAPALALLAGGALTLLPYVHQQLGVLTLAGVFGVVWTIDAVLAVDRASRRGATARASAMRGAMLGAALATTFLCCGQYGVFAALAAAPPALVLWASRWRERARWIAAAVAIAVTVVAVAPVLLAQRRAAGQHPMRRLPVQIAAGAASPLTWLRTSGVEVVPQPSPSASPRGLRALFPGTLKLVLAIGAMVVVARSRETPQLAAPAASAGVRDTRPEPRPPRHGGHADRRALWFVAGTGIVAFLWSFLPGLFGGWPVAALMSELPGLGQIRNVWRMGAITQIAVVALAFVALDRAVARAGGQRLRLAAWALAVAATVELWPWSPRLDPYPRSERWRPVLAWIETHVPRDGTIAHLPMPASVKEADFLDTTGWMLLGCEHGRRLVNGYSGSLPFAHYRLWKTLEAFPDPASTAALLSTGVSAVVVEDAWLDRADHRARVGAAGWRTALVAPETGVTIFVR